MILRNSNFSEFAFNGKRIFLSRILHCYVFVLLFVYFSPQLGFKMIQNNKKKVTRGEQKKQTTTPVSHLKCCNSYKLNPSKLPMKPKLCC